MSKRHLTKNEILEKARAEKMAQSAAGKATLILALYVLHDKFDFDAEGLRSFVDGYEDLLDYYNDSNDYQNLLYQWNDYFRDYAGISVINSTKHMEVRG